MTRLVPVGAILGAPLLAAALQQHRGRAAQPVTARGQRGWVAMVAAAALAAVPLAEAVAQHPVDVPVGLSPALAELPAGTVVLDDDDISAWLLWSAPHLVPAIDGRTEIDAPVYLSAYYDVLNARAGWHGFVARSRATYALVRADSTLASALSEVNGCAGGRPPPPRGGCCSPSRERGVGSVIASLRKPQPRGRVPPTAPLPRLERPESPLRFAT